MTTPLLRLIVADDPHGAGRLVAEEIRSVVRTTVGCRLGLATGSTPRPAYQELLGAHADDDDGLFDDVTALLLDEYVGLGPDDPRSYRATIRSELTDGLGIPPARVLGPDTALEPASACAAYEATVRAGGVDLQLLGIGRNGHIGFNEPGTPFDSPTHVVELSPTTRADNARFFDRPQDVPTRAITQGIGTILRSRRLLLAATGTAKAAAVAAALEGPVGPDCPASAIRRHPRVTVVLDRAAASGLSPSARSAD